MVEEQHRPVLQGEYKLVSVLETVEDSTVYRSQSVSHSERVFAIREFKLEGFEAPEKRAMVSSYFQPIAQSYMDFSDPCLTSLRDFFIENGYIYFVFDFVPGCRLSNYLRMRHRPLPEVLALDISYKIARAMELLHSRDPIKFFADVSISNVILASNGYIMLTDYGLGKLLAPRPIDAPRMGTPGYAAPEQFSADRQSDARTDIYSLGMTMHHLATGKSPSEPPYVTDIHSKQQIKGFFRFIRNPHFFDTGQKRQLIRHFSVAEQNRVLPHFYEGQPHGCRGTECITVRVDMTADGNTLCVPDHPGYCFRIPAHRCHRIRSLY